MPTHVGRATTEIITEPEPYGEAETEDSRWEESEKIRKTMTRMESLERRTRAEGFDD